jgi:diaminopimelate epimerase
MLRNFVLKRAHCCSLFYTVLKDSKKYGGIIKALVHTAEQDVGIHWKKHREHLYMSGNLVHALSKHRKRALH